MRVSYNRKLTRTWSVLFPLTIINFSIFAIINSLIGGGVPEVVNGGYFLNNHLHYTPVSKTVFFYTVLHLALIVISFILSGILSFLVFTAFGTLNIRELSRELENLDKVAIKLQIISSGFVVLMFVALIYLDFLR